MKFLYLLLFIQAIVAWGPGNFIDRGNWLPCHTSCKEWTSISSCTICEDYMFLNTVTKYWDFCADGEYFDFSIEQWNSCGSSCSGFCKYQSICFQCEPTKSLDLETMSCLPNCGNDKFNLSDNQTFELTNFCRRPVYYIDPSSDKILELGTQNYPYRTIRPVFVEILKYFSHQEISVSVFF